MNYGVIGNCQVAALIDEQARMIWACLPRPDGDPVFSADIENDGLHRWSLVAARP